MKHLLLRLNGPVTNERFVYNLLMKALHNAQAEVFTSMSYPFYPQGLSAVAIIGESHAFAETYPEDGRVYVDFFSCSDDPDGQFAKFIQSWIDNGFGIEKQEIVDR